MRYSILNVLKQGLAGQKGWQPAWRDAAPNARITASDIDKAVAYANEHMLENKDVNSNGYSADEVKTFSTTAKAFLHVGQMLEAGIIKS